MKGCVEDIVNNDVECKIGLTKWNILAYAEDIVLMALYLKDLQKLIDILRESIKNISIKINVKNSKYIVFEKRNIYSWIFS